MNETPAAPAVNATEELPSNLPPAHWKKIAAPYSTPDLKASVIQLGTTAVLFAFFWVATYLAYVHVGYWLALLLAVPAGAFIVRLFMIQHDCGHGSYFRSRKACDIVGFILGVITLTPYQYWRQTHAYHHSHSGDLDFRGLGDILTLTLDEYRQRTPWGRFCYRIYRNPFVLLGFGPAVHFIFKHRYPWDIPGIWKAAWRSVWLTNLALVAIVFVMGNLIGYGTFFAIQLPITLAACTIGVWLFYVQHQFEDTYWHKHTNWNYFDAALMGSSHLILPKPLQWITANIGIHHVHHLSSGIPNYKLQECMDANPELQRSPKITAMDSFRLLRLTLWDEAAQELVTFREATKRMNQSGNNTPTTA